MKKIICACMIIALAGAYAFAGDVAEVTTKQGWTTVYEIKDSLNELATGGTLTNGLAITGAATVSTTLGVTGETTLAAAVNIVAIDIGDTTNYTFLAANSGHAHIIPDLPADSVFTMPAEAVGLHYKLVYGGAAADAQDWSIDTGADANYFAGGLTQFDKSIATNSVVVYYSDGNSNSKIGVLTPEAGTVVEMWCVDGTTWYVSGYVVSSTTTGVTFGDQ